jgi:hypothetical protein
MDSQTTRGGLTNAIRNVGDPRYDKAVKALRYNVTHEVRDLRKIT